MIEVAIRPDVAGLWVLDGRSLVSAALSESGEVQCTAAGVGLFKAIRNDDGTVDARFSQGDLRRLVNLRL
jgi:hypothetical protein